MLQRIQTVYLILASACMLLAILLPLATFSIDGQAVQFEAMGFYMQRELIFPTWGLFAVATLSALLSLVIIFLYKNRILQIRLTGFNILLMIGFYAFFAFLIYVRNPEVNSSFEKIGFGIMMPLIAIILSYLAIRKIGADEALVRSLNRIR